MSLNWQLVGEECFVAADGTSHEPATSPQFRAVVERIVGGVWDWGIWRTGEASHRAWGIAETAAAAMLAAERAMAHERRSGVPGVANRRHVGPHAGNDSMRWLKVA